MTEKQVTGGGESLFLPGNTSSDERRIRQGIDEAARNQRAIDHATARRIAVQLHSGQFSPLYALASCGAIREADEDDETGGVETGIHEELAQCRRYLGEKIEPWAVALDHYIDSRNDNDPIEGWRELTSDRVDKGDDRATGGFDPSNACVACGAHISEPCASDCSREARRERVPSPRIYVASLADYVSGELLGRWIDADQDPEELQAEIAEMLAQSSEPVAEEWAIHDYEGFGSFRVGEYESMEVVSAVALGIVECGAAFAAYASWAGTSDEALRHFNDCYMGHWSSLEKFARDTAEDFGWEAALRALPEDMQSFVDIDYEQLARFLESVMNIVEGGGGIYVFNEG